MADYISREAAIEVFENADADVLEDYRRKEEKKMDYKEAAEKLCDGYLDMPSGCGGCPLATGEYDSDGNMVCALNTVVGPPTVDTVPVVRCRDCVSYGVDEYGDFRCNHPEGMDFPGDNDFCSYGQRKDQSADVRNMEADNAPESPD